MGKAGPKKSPAKKAEKGSEKPVKRLGSEKKATVAVRKSSRNVPGPSKPDPAEAKSVKVTTGAKSKPLKPKKSDEEPPAQEEDVNGDVSSTSEPEDGASDEPEVKPGPSNATKGKSDKSKATGAKVSKVTVEHCKS